MTLLLPSRRALNVAPYCRNELWRRARSMPTLDLRFAESRSLIDAVTGRQLITYSRVSAGTFVGSNGLIQTAAENEPRFTHDPATGESLGVLVEEQRTNLLLNSATFQPTSGGSPASYTVDQVAPDGTTTGSRQTAATPRTLVDYTEIANALYTFSFYCRVTSGTAAFSVLLKNAASDTVITSNGSLVATTTWKRFTISGTTAGAIPGARIELLGVVPGFVFWGAQLEEGPIASSYIPTTTTAVTRAADVLSITGANFSSWYRQNEGTLYTEGNSSNLSAGKFPTFASISDGTSNNRLQYGYITDIMLGGFIVRSAGSLVADLYPPGSVNPGRAVFAAAADNFAASFNGGASSVDTSGAMPVGVNQMQIGDRLGIATANFNGPIRRLVYWPQRLPNSILQALSA
jgi:hypothetical protein